MEHFMSLPYNLEIGNVYQFDFVNSTIMNSRYTSAKVLAILDFESAAAIKDVRGIHAALLPELPAGTVRDATKLIYIKLKTNTGATDVVAFSWLASAPTAITSNTFVVNIPNRPLQDQSLIASALKSVGINVFEITVE
jgi:hypothetical protein